MWYGGGGKPGRTELSTCGIWWPLWIVSGLCWIVRHSPGIRIACCWCWWKHNTPTSDTGTYGCAEQLCLNYLGKDIKTSGLWYTLENPGARIWESWRQCISVWGGSHRGRVATISCGFSGDRSANEISVLKRSSRQGQAWMDGLHRLQERLETMKNIMSSPKEISLIPLTAFI